MSAKPELVRPHSIDSAWEHAVAQMEENEHIIRGLRKQNERLEAELLNTSLRASLAVNQAKFEAAQVGEAHRRIAALEKEVAKLADAQNATAQIVQGLVDLPDRVDELARGTR